MDKNIFWQKDLPPEFMPMQPFAKKDSLTLALKKLQAAFSVQLLNLNISTPFIDEAPFFSYTEDPDVLAREVILKLDQYPVIFARSICHQTSENWLDILDCGNRSLGEKLFDGSLPITRGKFEYKVMLPETYFSSVYQPKIPLAPCLARRSVFWLEEKPLLLTEIFLPELKSFL